MPVFFQEEMVLLGTTTKDSMKRTDKPGLGQGLENDEEY